MPAHVLFLVVLCVTVACVSGKRSPSGFSLPEGNVERGHALFTELGCHSCHTMDGMVLLREPDGLTQPVALGGETLRVRTDGELVTAIINPSHALARGYPAAVVSDGGRSRMGSYNQALTVRQHIDLVAFLHTRYRTAPPTPKA
jgi:hypothetical protein